MARDSPLHGQGLSIGTAWPGTLLCVVRDSPLALLGQGLSIGIAWPGTLHWHCLARDSPLHGQGLSIGTAWPGTLLCVVRDSPLALLGQGLSIGIAWPGTLHWHCLARDSPLHGQGLSIGTAWPGSLHCMVRDSSLALLGQGLSIAWSGTLHWHCLARDSPLHGQGLSIAWPGTLHCMFADLLPIALLSWERKASWSGTLHCMFTDPSQFVWQLQGLHSCDLPPGSPPPPPPPSYLLICLPQLSGTPVFLTSSLHLPRLPCLATPLRWWIVVTTHPVSGSPPLWLRITWPSTENRFSPSWLFTWSHSQRTVWSGLLQDIITNNNMDWWKETNHLEYFECLSVFLFVTWSVQVQESRQFEIYWPQESVWTKTLSLVTGHFSWDGPFWIKAQTRQYLATCRAVGN